MTHDKKQRLLIALLVFIACLVIPRPAFAAPLISSTVIEPMVGERKFPGDTILRGAQAGVWKEIDDGVGYLRSNGTFITDSWAVIDGVRYRFDSNGMRLTGWQQIDDLWYYFGDDGAMRTNEWVPASDGINRYVGETGEMYASRHHPDGGYFDADGIYDPYAGPYASGGTYYWTDVAGVNRQDLVNSLEEHKDEYLYTRYTSYPCGIPGEGMHCAGFVSRGLYDAGFTYNFDNGATPEHYEELAGYNLGTCFKDDIDQYANINTWHTTGYVLWAANNNVRWIGYTSHEALVEGAKRGEYQKGDFMMYTYAMPELWWHLEVEHVCYYWGEGDNWLVWESMPGGNYIRERSTCGGTIVVLTSVDYLND